MALACTFAMFRTILNWQMGHCKVLLADRSEVYMMGLKEVFRPFLTQFAVKELTDPDHLSNWLETEKPHVLVSEVDFLDELSDNCLKRLKSNNPALKIVVLSNNVSEMLIQRAIRNGVDGYLKKDRPALDVLEALKAVISGSKYFSPEISSLFFQSVSFQQHELTERELEVLRYICRGRSNEQIADILNLSEKTVATHKKNIMRKAKVKKTPELIFWAVNSKIVTLT